MGELFAKSPVSSRHCIEAVTDSSRYFVITLLDPLTKNEATVGLGFQNAAFAFDLNAGVQDYFNRLSRTGEYSLNPNVLEAALLKVESESSAEIDDDEFGDFQS